MFRLADYLKLSLADIKAMDWQDYQDWFAYLKIKQQEQDTHR
jgi:hypothetical protein